MDKEYKEALERIETLEKELARVKRAIIALSEGHPVDEYMDFDKNTFLEFNEIWRKTYIGLAHMMECLMMLNYCTYYTVDKKLRKKCEKYREEVSMYTQWHWKEQDVYLITILTDDFQDIYEYGIACYKRSAKDQLDLCDMVDQLPEKCPWTLEELMENEIYELTGKLPKREKRK